MSKNDILTQKMIKKYAPFLSVQGAYVQQPRPAIYGIDDHEVIASNDATSLYPNIEILSNIGYETLQGRVYDTGILDNLIDLLFKIEKNKEQKEIIKKQARMAFENAIKSIIKNYFTRYSVQNKKEFTEVNLNLLLTFFDNILKAILDKNISLENIFKPTDDYTYYLLRSNLFPLFESINWLHHKNKRFSEVFIDWAYSENEKEFDYIYQNKKFFVFDKVNSTKINFLILNLNEFKNYIKNYLFNPYGTFYKKHKDKLAYSVIENIEGLKRRKKIKNTMLCIEGLIAGWDKLSSEDIQIFLNKPEKFKLTEEEIKKLFEEIDLHDENKIKWRISSLKDFEFEKNYSDEKSLKRYLEIRASQLNNFQLAIKVSLNSGYGITGLITYQYSSPLIANSITTGGKILGIKTFQQIAVNTIDESKEIFKFNKKWVETVDHDWHTLYSDTDSAYLRYKLPFNKFEDVKRTVDYVQDYALKINENYLELLNTKMRQRVNLDPDYNLMNFKSEVVAYRGFFRSKKYYALAKIWDEGNFFDKPKMKKTGGQIVKSDTTRITYDLLNDVYYQLVLNFDIKEEKILYKSIFFDLKNQYTQKLKDDIHNFNILSFGIPKKWGLGEFKNIPKQVLGGLLYNTIFENILRPGESMYLIQIKIKNLKKLYDLYDQLKSKNEINEYPNGYQLRKDLINNKLNVISIPTEVAQNKNKLEKLIKTFKEYEIELDLDTIVNFNIDMKLEQFKVLFNEEIRLKSIA